MLNAKRKGSLSFSGHQHGVKSANLLPVDDFLHLRRPKLFSTPGVRKLTVKPRKTSHQSDQTYTWDLGMHHWIINLLPAKPVRASIKHASLLALSKMIIKEIVMEGYNTSSKWWIPLEKFGGWIDLATFGNLWFKQLDAFDQLVVAMHVSTMLEQSLGSPISGLVGCTCEGLRTSC